jgi:two-component system OmpR family response regulator/two-component system response regulator CpxR
MAKGRILLAHGNSDCQTIYGSALRYEGYDVDIVCDVESALAWLGILSYDVVIADLYLPSVADECLLRRMRHEASAAHIPVIVLTGWSTEAHRQVAMDADADDFLPLPTRPRELADAVAAILREPSRRHARTSDPIEARDRPIANGL